MAVAVECGKVAQFVAAYDINVMRALAQGSLSRVAQSHWATL